MLCVYLFCLLLVMNQIQLLVGPKMHCNDQYSCSLADDTDRNYFTLERKTGYVDTYPIIYVLALFRASLTSFRASPAFPKPTSSSTIL